MEKFFSSKESQYQPLLAKEPEKEDCQDQKITTNNNISKYFPEGAKISIASQTLIKGEMHNTFKVEYNGKTYTGTCNLKGMPINKWLLNTGDSKPLEIIFVEEYFKENDLRFVNCFFIKHLFTIGEPVLGTCFNKKGICTGEFKDWEIHGIGTYKYFNGKKFQGEFKDGKISNYHSGPHTIRGDYSGTLTNTNGTKYTGKINDKIEMDGRGTLTLLDGKTIEGKWHKDMEIGGEIYKIINKKDATEYMGEIKDLQPHGEGRIVHFEDNSLQTPSFVINGNWVNGKKELDAKIEYPDGKIEQVIYSNDEIIYPQSFNQSQPNVNLQKIGSVDIKNGAGIDISQIDMVFREDSLRYSEQVGVHSKNQNTSPKREEDGVAMIKAFSK